MDLVSKKKNKLDECFSEIASLGADNDNILDKISMFCLVLTPLLQHYKGFVVELAVCVLLVLMPYLFIKFLKKVKTIKFSDFAIVMPLVVFKVYTVIANGTNLIEMAHASVICFYFIIAAAGCINIKSFIKYGYCVAVAASITIILQYFCFFVLGFHLQLVPTSLLLPEADIWIGGAETGMINVTGGYNDFYRPSSFFLEPSHMFLYMFPQLFIVLLSPGKKPWKLGSAILLTIGMILSTSGMGMCVAAGAWGLYVACSSGKDNVINLKYLLRKSNLWKIPVFVLVCVALYYLVPFIEESISRIFVSEGEASTAITGRTVSAKSIVGALEGEDLVFGVADSIAGLNCNMSGFMATVYKYGIVGTVLSYIYYLISFLGLKYQYVWIAFIILVVSYFSAHTHGTFYMIYYVLILLEGWHSARNTGLLKKSNK